MSTEYLRRYTDLPNLLYLLINSKLTLLDPSAWEDKNDIYFLLKYKELKKLQTLLALCFTTKAETFHHWKVFAGHSGGICIRFKKEKLLNSLTNTKITTGPVNYRLMRNLQSDPPLLADLPFIKRKQYEDESEYRIIYEDRNKTNYVKSFAINLNCIERITLSPWLPLALSDTIKSTIRQIPGCSSIEIIRTGVVENMQWKRIADKCLREQTMKRKVR